jgi:F-type H+-transporting ATPase subunit b
MFTAIAQFGDSSSGIGALGLDGKALIIQLISFVLAFLVLKKWAFGPIIKAMERRRETIEKGVKLGEEMQKEKAAFEEKVAKALGDAREQADQIVGGAQSQAREAIHEAEDKARAKAETIIAEAQDRINQDTKRARQQLEKELAGLIAEATEAVVGEKVDANKDAALIDKALKEQAKA